MGPFSYTFKSEEKITIGPCIFNVVRGERQPILDHKMDDRLLQLYFPELKLAVTRYGSEPVFDDLKTTFAPITPIP